MASSFTSHHRKVLESFCYQYYISSEDPYTFRMPSEVVHEGRNVRLSGTFQMTKQISVFRWLKELYFLLYAKGLKHKMFTQFHTGTVSNVSATCCQLQNVAQHCIDRDCCDSVKKRQVHLSTL